MQELPPATVAEPDDPNAAEIAATAFRPVRRARAMSYEIHAVAWFAMSGLAPPLVPSEAWSVMRTVAA